MRYTFTKPERLKNDKEISRLFEEGKSITVFPIRLIYLCCDENDKVLIKVAFTASKRNFKKAVDRNRIKRLLRESYRLNKPLLYQSLDTKNYIFMFIYIGKEVFKMETVNDKMLQLFDKFLSNEKHK
ncbi:MAG: ribonuclease P protein component [Flavobacteriaceae bacterium]|nr:ribonuclease P protein component [Flavobacteriaceae bacterium]